MEVVTDFKQALRHVCNTITNMFLGAIIFVSCIFAFRFSDVSLRQHVVLNMIGYVLLMPQAILALSDYCSWARVLSPDVRQKVHIVLHVIGSIFVLAGSIIRINAMASFGWRNFTHAHGIFGLIALILTCLNLLVGLINFFNQRDIRVMKIIHAVLGCLTIVVAFIAVVIGFNSELIVFFMGQGSAIILTIIAVFAMVDIVSCACLKIIRG